MGKAAKDQRLAFEELQTLPVAEAAEVEALHRHRTIRGELDPSVGDAESAAAEHAVDAESIPDDGPFGKRLVHSEIVVRVWGGVVGGPGSELREASGLLGGRVTRSQLGQEDRPVGVAAAGELAGAPRVAAVDLRDEAVDRQRTGDEGGGEAGVPAEPLVEAPAEQQ